MGQEIPICTATQDQTIPVIASDGVYSSAELSDSITIIGSAYWYDPSTFLYEVTDHIRCGRGYWVLIDGAGEMSFPVLDK